MLFAVKGGLFAQVAQKDLLQHVVGIVAAVELGRRQTVDGGGIVPDDRLWVHRVHWRSLPSAYNTRQGAERLHGMWKISCFFERGVI